MKPLSELSSREAARLVAVATDLDDTVLDHGRLGVDALTAISLLGDAGLDVLIATGRPLGWAEVVCRLLPVAAVLAENGACAAVRDGARVVTRFRATEAERRSRSARLDALVAELLARVPSARVTDDAWMRATDRTFDVGETWRAPAEHVAELIAIAAAREARTSVSSVHLHVTFEGDDKASGIAWLARELFSLDPTAARARVAFVGDSGNDAAAFAGFETTFGVANVRLARGLSVPPRYVARRERGLGFAEITRAIVDARARERAR
ncbi:MAG: HAD-IIB family hydrolase [Polyangiaceae bacterium]|nr:HAD-IIB family hydrolase [Polyangiaceae bacterium]